jgi:Reverse transcriptase (RNA-dependent DNA polymerase)/RNase H-like domain found in reverse transcriptase/Integrase zinc binding domain/Chromo (CHRromatin Organisation MOdifier) domain/gag-polyprotein putative aspartyl protease
VAEQIFSDTLCFDSFSHLAVQDDSVMADLAADVLSDTYQDPAFFAFPDLVEACGFKRHDPTPSNVYLGSLGTTQPVNKRLIQIPAVASAKHGEIRSSVYALVDTGATHCFIHANLAKHLGLKIHPIVKQNAILGNGLNMPLQGYTYVSLLMGEFKEEVKCLVANTGDLSIILGDEWLSTRNVTIAYNPKRLHIYSNGRKICLNGVHDISKYGLKTTMIDLKNTDSETLLNATAFHSLMENNAFKEAPTLIRVKHKPDPRGQTLPTIPEDDRYIDSFDIGQFNAFKSKPLSSDKKGDGPPPPPAEGLMPQSRLDALLQDMRDCFPDALPGVSAIRDYGLNVPSHTIPLLDNVHPPFIPGRRYSPVENEEIQIQIKDLLEKKLIQPSYSPYGAPVLFANKKDGTLRMCIDYRALNKLTVKNKYPIPRIDDLLDKLHGAKVFSSLDLLAGYHQIPMSSADKPKTAFNTPQGHFEWNVMPFGLTNAPATFQSTMNTILAPVLNKFALVYLDDILIYSKTAAEHEEHLRAVLQILKDNNFYCKMSKCDFNKPEVKYLGHIVGRYGVKVDPAKVLAVSNWPQPTTVTEVQAFLGLANYFHRFIPDHSSITGPLSDLTKGPMTGKKRHRNSPAISIQWNPACQLAFDTIKALLCAAPVLKLPDFSQPFEVMVDASLLGTGAVLLQDGHPVAYESHKLSSAEKNYSTGEQEMLAVIRALTVWRVYLEGPQFTVLTDHNPNTFFGSMKDLSRRQVRWSEFLSRYNFDWKYIPGKKNISDGLSRISLTSTDKSYPSLSCITITAMTRSHTPRSSGVPHSKGGEELRILTDLEQQIVAAYQNDEWYKDPVNIVNLTMRDGLWYAIDNTISVPKPIRQSILEEAHDALTGAHLGITKTIKKIRRHYQWPHLKDDVTEWINTCMECMRNKSHKTISQGLLQPLPIPTRRFGSISMDFVTCLPKSPQKNDAIFVIVDRLTKYARFIPCKTTLSSEQCAKLFHSRWVADVCGIPDDIVSDRDGRFFGSFWQELMQHLGTKLKMSSAYHPQTDGQTERMNRTMEEMLRAYVNPQMDNWEEFLPLVQHAYNDSVQASTSYTPYMAAYGHEPKDPLTPSAHSRNPSVIEFQEEIKTTIAELKVNLAAAQHRQATYADQNRVEKVLAVGDEVMLSTQHLNLKRPKDRKLTSKKLMPKYVGPYTVLECVGKTSYLLKLPEGWKVHPVVHVSLLQLIPKGARYKDRPLALEMEDGSLEWEVRAILDVKINKSGLPYKYLVAWTGFGPEEHRWEPASALSKCTEALDEFWQRREVLNE